jgi:hypothetical protein
LLGAVEQGFDRGFHGVEVERLRHHDRILELRDVAQATVAGGEGERNPTAPQGVGELIAGLVAEVHVEDGAVEFTALGELEPIGHGGARAYDLAAKLGQPILDQHRNQGFVVDDEDARQLRQSYKELASR